VIRGDRELLAELAQLNGDIASLGMRIMDGSASAAEQPHYAQRLITAGQRLNHRAKKISGSVIEGEVLTEKTITLPQQPAEQPQNMENASRKRGLICHGWTGRDHPRGHPGR
jgi:hypothetical protein